jgi:hypothetical protein
MTYHITLKGTGEVRVDKLYVLCEGAGVSPGAFVGHSPEVGALSALQQRPEMGLSFDELMQLLDGKLTFAISQ